VIDTQLLIRFYRSDLFFLMPDESLIFIHIDV